MILEQILFEAMHLPAYSSSQMPLGIFSKKQVEFLSDILSSPCDLITILFIAYTFAARFAWKKTIQALLNCIYFSDFQTLGHLKPQRCYIKQKLLLISAVGQRSLKQHYLWSIAFYFNVYPNSVWGFSLSSLASSASFNTSVSVTLTELISPQNMPNAKV